MPQRATEAARFESLAFQVEAPPGGRLDDAASEALRRAFPADRWVVYPLNPADGEFEAVPVARGRRRSPTAGRSRRRRAAVPVTAAGAWDLAYRLRDRPEVVYAEPLFTVEDRQQQPTAGPRARGGSDREDPGTERDCEWSLKTLRVKDAWALFAGRRPGDRVVIGHPDTGYTEHPEIVSARLRADEGYDFEGERPDPRDALSEQPLGNPGHGTSTASVIISGAGKPAGWQKDVFVSGVAPGASLIPIRTTRSVVLWSMSGLTRAIRFAIEKPVHVVSVSLGGPFPSIALHNALRDAERAGIIVCCAAGNVVRFVVYPAAFDEVIAVAASRIDDTEWPDSCRGPAVDITAPGSSVWRARTELVDGGLDFDVRRGSGTSYAVAATAGLAALWLSFHGRRSLVERYGADRVPSVFKQVLQATCRTPAGWDTTNFGPGIAHAGRLLQAPLPDRAVARGLAAERRPPSQDAPLEVIVHQLAPAPRSGVERMLADLLHVTEEQLPRTLNDVGAELAMRIGLDPALRARLQAAAAAGPAPRGRARALPPATAARRGLRSLNTSRRLGAYLAG